MTRTVLILGSSGRIGRHASRAFAAAGWQVRTFQRGTDMNAAARGCEVIVNGLNPPNYHDWANLIPAITAEVLAAAKASGATVILPGNVYNFGDSPGIWDEHTPRRPVSVKGRIREEMEAAYRASGVQTIVLRAGNFIDPDGPGDILDLMTFKSLAKGRVTAAGDPDAEQAWCYLPDWARAAVALAERRETLSTFEDVPFPGQTYTMREMAAIASERIGAPVRIGQFPWWLLAVLSPVWELARELREMRYLSSTSHRLSGETFARLLPGFEMTSEADALAASIDHKVHPDKPMRAGGAPVRAQ